jgi:hypothetical protein
MKKVFLCILLCVSCDSQVKCSISSKTEFDLKARELCQRTDEAVQLVSDFYLSLMYPDKRDEITVTWQSGKCIEETYFNCVIGRAKNCHILIATHWEFTNHDVFSHEILHCVVPKLNHNSQDFIDTARASSIYLKEFGY